MTMTEMKMAKSLANRQMYFNLTILSFVLMTALAVTALVTNAWGHFEDGSYFGLFEMCSSQDECTTEGVTIREIVIRSIIVTSLASSSIGFIITIYGKLRSSSCWMVFGVVFFYVGACTLLVGMMMFAIRPYGDTRWGYSTIAGWMSVVTAFYMGIVAQISMSHHERNFVEDTPSQEQTV